MSMTKGRRNTREAFDDDNKREEEWHAFWNQYSGLDRSLVWR